MKHGMKRGMKHIFAPAADLYYEEGTSVERLSLSVRRLLEWVSGEKDPLLNELLRLSEENSKLKDTLEDIQDSLNRALQSKVITKRD